MPQRFWDRDTAIRALQYEAQRLGRTPRDKDLRSPTRTCASLKTYHRIFGSLHAAALAAGLQPRRLGANAGWRKPRCHRGHERTADNVDRQGHCRRCAAFWKRREGMGPMLPRVRPIKPSAAEVTAAKKAYWRMAS